MVDVAPIVTARGLAEALAFRDSVLAEERGVDASEVGDELDRDPTTLHCVVRGPDGACIGTGRLTAPVDSEVGGHVVEGIPAIGPVVVARSVRRGDIASSILAFLEDQALALYGRNGTVRVEMTDSSSVSRRTWPELLGAISRRAPGQHGRREARA